MKKKTIADILRLKGDRGISMLTAYDFQMASLLDHAEVDMILVGDSLGNIIYGEETTLPVTLDLMIHHTRAVSRATKQALVVGDLPFGSYQTSIPDAIRSACRMLAEGGAQAVKLEGGKTMGETVQALVERGIPVMGHIGLTPQSVHQMSGYRMQGKTEDQARELVSAAKCIQDAGAFAIVLECVAHDVAQTITSELKIPTIGIGSGQRCDGQVLVINDLIGLNIGHIPKFVRSIMNLRNDLGEALAYYIQDVREKKDQGV